MADRIESFQVTIPAGTAQASPLLTATTFDAGRVDRVEILIPPGPSGLVGFQLAHSSEVVIPYDGSQFIVADDEVIKWDLTNYPTGGAWGVRGYNTDVYDHTLYLRYLITETEASIARVVPPLDVTQPEQPAPVDEQQPLEFPYSDDKSLPTGEVFDR